VINVDNAVGGGSVDEVVAQQKFVVVEKRTGNGVHLNYKFERVASRRCVPDTVANEA
jgi:hypothetical protein